MGSIVVEPNNPANTHDLSFFINGRKWGIKLSEGARSVSELPSQPSNILINAKGRRTGDYDPSHGHEEIRTWEGGRGIEFHSDDNTRFFDSLNAWTLTPGLWHQAPQWIFSDGYAQHDNLMPGGQRFNPGRSMRWRRLDSTAHYARSHISVSSFAQDDVMLWARRWGQPAPLTVRYLSSASNRPASSVSSGITTNASTSIEEGVSVILTASLSTAVTQSSAGNHWVEVYTTAAGNTGNYWEIGYSPSVGVNSTSLISSNGASGTWAASTVNFYTRILTTPIDVRSWLFFRLDSALYAVDKPNTAADSLWLINGDRGKCSSNGSTALLTAATVVGGAWEGNEWSQVGARVRIIRGTGAGQNSAISSNGTTSMGVSLIVAPASDSEFVIYDTPVWHQLSTAVQSSIGKGQVTDVAVVNNIAYFAFGASTSIGQLRWNSSVHEGQKSGSTNSDFLHVYSDPDSSRVQPELWRAISSVGQVSHSTLAAWGSTLLFSSGIPVGGTAYRFTNMNDYDGRLYIFKEDSLWEIQNEAANKLNVGLEGHTSSFNGAAVLSQNTFQFMSWSHSLERMFGGTLDDIGPWQGGGLPSGRQGHISALAPIIAFTAAGIDAGTTGISSILLHNGRGWHEIFRAWATNRRVDELFFQSNPGGFDRLWVGLEGEIISMQFPRLTLNPRNDKGMNYQHEGHVITGTIDMASMQLPKLFSEVHAITQNLASTTAEIATEYQLDDDIGSTFWLSIGSFIRSPSDVLTINRGDKRAIRFRFRALTSVSTIAAEMHDTVIKSVGRTPIKRQWNIRAEIGSFQVDAQGFPDADPDDWYEAMRQAAITAVPIHMGARWKSMHNIEVYTEGIAWRRKYSTPDGKWGAALNLTIREV